MTRMAAGSSMLDRYLRRDGMYHIMPAGVAVQDRYQKRMVRLDPLGSEIWLRIDGVTRLREIAQDIAGQTGQPLDILLQQATAMTGILIGEGLVHLSLTPEPLAYHLTLPFEDLDQARMVESLRAAGWYVDG